MKKLMYLFFIFVFSFAMNAQEIRDTVIITEEWRYEGQWPEGQGVLFHDFKGFYVGRFSNGLPEGYCVQFTPYADYYGTFKSGVREGKGTISYKNGDMLQGAFVNGKANGAAKYFYKCDSLFWGGYINGERGAGKMMYSSTMDIGSQRPKLPDVVVSNEQAKYITSLDSIARATTFPAKFRGGDLNSFSKWVNSRLKVTSDIRKELKDSGQNSAKCILRFTVNEMGELRDVHILNESPSPSFDRMVMNVVLSSSEHWEPAQEWAQPKGTTYTFPVIIRL